MSTSRTVVRGLAVAAVVALTGALGAGPAVSQTPSADDEPHGVVVAGLTSNEVSGEAQGARVFDRLNLDAIITPAAAALAPKIGGATPGFWKSFVADAGAHAAAGSATGTDVGEVGFAPEVELPAQGGGPLKDDKDKLVLEQPGGLGPVTIAKDLTVETQGAIGDAGYAHSESTLHDVVGALMNADKLEVDCDADLTSVHGSTEVDDGTHADSNFNAARIPDHPDPNEEVADFTIDEPFSPTEVDHLHYQLVANEQDKDDHSITVTGLHEKLTVTATDPTNPSAPPVEIQFIETRYGQAHCDIHPVAAAVTVEPTFTG